jgi:uncharacterized protein
MGRVEAGAGVTVEVIYCPGPGVVDRVCLTLGAGATVAEALHASGLAERHGLDVQALRVGLWCKARELSTTLRDGDRVEVYRPLTVDPKEARRLRYKRHREAAAAR